MLLVFFATQQSHYRRFGDKHREKQHILPDPTFVECPGFGRVQARFSAATTSSATTLSLTHTPKGTLIIFQPIFPESGEWENTSSRHTRLEMACDCAVDTLSQEASQLCRHLSGILSRPTIEGN